MDVIPPWTPHVVSQHPWTNQGMHLDNDKYPDYTFNISRRHASRANMAFLDGHVEDGSLRDWTLIVSAV